MSSRRRILVFPCGSEVALEIKKSVEQSSHFELIGASSIDDHGRFAYANYISGIPFHDSPDFANHLKKIIEIYKIDAIYPAMDSVANTLQNLSNEIDCKIVGSSPHATAICNSKRSTYHLLKNIIPLPKEYRSINEAKFPIFIKPNIGYGSRNCHKFHDYNSANVFLKNTKTDFILQEYLDGKEWTVDCFSNRHGELLFHGARERKRISNGISVRTEPSKENFDIFKEWAKKINEVLRPRGAWFFQAKSNSNNSPFLLEVAVRPGGSSSLFRCQGINFPLLSLFDAFNIDVKIQKNDYFIELDRALDNKFKISHDFQSIYIDLDDCLIIQNAINYRLMSFIYKSINENKKITLITRHANDPITTLKKFKASEIFDKIIHLKNNEKKSSFIKEKQSIFIDDSFNERLEVAHALGIPVFSPDMIEALL